MKWNNTNDISLINDLKAYKEVLKVLNSNIESLNNQLQKLIDEKTK